MSTIDEINVRNYSELTRVYMGGLISTKFDEFLNTTQTGFAQSSSGTELKILFKALFTAFCFCTIQLTFFCFFRPIFKSLYQPRCYCVPTSERMEPLPRGFVAWVAPTLQYSINYYLSLGLDAYFFIRFVSISLLYFLVLGTLNIIILTPINWTGSTVEYSAAGIDRLSLTNIANINVQRLNAHFVMSLVTIVSFHWLLIYELDSFVKIRQSYLLSPIHRNSIIARTLLISNVPKHLRNVEVLNKVFEPIPGGVKTLWLSYNFHKIKHLVRQAHDSMQILESAQISYLKKFLSRHINGSTNFQSYFKSDSDKLDSYLEAHVNERLEYDQTLSPLFFPPIYFAPRTVPFIGRTISLKLPGFLRLFRLEKWQRKVDWAIDSLNSLQLEIEKEKEKLTNGELSTHDKIIVEFNDQTGASIAHQCLLSQTQGALSQSLIEVHPEDVLWNNIARNGSVVSFFEKYIVTIIFIMVTILYIIPVSFIGLVSQIPLMTTLVPYLKWINKLPEEARDSVSRLLPSLLLAILTEIVMVTFRFLSYFKGNQTGATRETSLQKWYFAFLFVQQFLVITISSSITFIFKQIVDQPTSIPILLAMNLPKAATFFFQYLTIKALTFCGNNFLRIDQLLMRLFFYRFADSSPRQKFKRITTLMRIKWGTIYPVYSVYVSIGLVYTIISPLISVFIVFIFFLVLLYYKYALKYVYSHVNESETQGRLYPVALLHLYTGVYCLEACMIGMFFLSKDEHESRVLRNQGYFMCVVLIFTIFGNVTVYKKYSKYISYTPIFSDKKFEDPKLVQMLLEGDISEHVSPIIETNESDELYSNRKLLYLHPAFKFEFPSIWLPADPIGISEFQIRHVESLVPFLTEGKTRGASISFRKTYHKIKIIISEAPPGYK